MEVQIPIDVSLAAGRRTSNLPHQSLTANESETDRKGILYQISSGTFRGLALRNYVIDDKDLHYHK